MAFLRFSRDRRGYEYFYLVESTTNRRGKTRARVLYWYRTPPNLKVGREPFDEEVRRALETQNPDVTFDWRKIVETPIPSAESERWRERRRAERAARVGRQEGAATDLVEEDDAMDEADATTDAPDLAVDAAERQADALAPTEESLVQTAASINPELEITPKPFVNPGSPGASPGRRRRRRRRRDRRISEQPNVASPVDGAPSDDARPREPHTVSEPHETKDGE
jgi:hypothetical protein